MVKITVLLGDLRQGLAFYPIFSTLHSLSHASLLLLTIAGAEQLERNNVWLLAPGKSSHRQQQAGYPESLPFGKEERTNTGAGENTEKLNI